jgi:hypothetical protein
MVAYAYDLLNRGNPAAFFGMVFVLEGTSVALALHAADRIQQTLALPNAAFSYLRSHGTLDQQHIRHLADLLARMTPADQAAVVRSARVFYKLYGDVFRTLPLPRGSEIHAAEECPHPAHRRERRSRPGTRLPVGRRGRRAPARRARQRPPERN